MSSRDDTQGIGMTHSATPALDTNDNVAFREHSQADGLPDAPFESIVDVFLPVRRLKVGFPLREEEGVDASVEMRVLLVLLHHKNKSDLIKQGVLGKEFEDRQDMNDKKGENGSRAGRDE